VVSLAERLHGRPELSLIEVLEAAQTVADPYKNKHLHRLLLTLSLDHEENWWKKIENYVCDA